MCKKFDDLPEPCRVTANLWPAYTYAGEIPGSEYDPSMISKGLFRGFLIERVCIWHSSLHFKLGLTNLCRS
jgi:hypothetical protein